MAANPLTYQELEAFERKNLVTFTAWQTEVLMRLDDAVLRVWSEDKTSGSAPSGNDPIPVTNTAGIKALFQGLQAKKAAQKLAKQGGARG